MALIKCTECGQMVSDKAAACPHCGAPVGVKKEEKSIICEECGQEMPESSTECPHCGAPVEKRGKGEERGSEETSTDKVRPKHSEVSKYALYKSPGSESSGFKRILIGCVTFLIIFYVLVIAFLAIILGNVEYDASITGVIVSINVLVALLLTRYITLRRRRKNREKTKGTKDVTSTNKREESITICLSAVLLIIVFSLVVATCSGCVGSLEGQPEVETPSSVQRKIKSVTTVEEAAEAINNTVWHYTEILDDSKIGFWIKVEFKDGRYTHYAASPSDGKWTKKGEGVFEIKEGRYSNTGERYIAVEWQGGDALGSSTDECNFSMVFENLQLSVSIAHPFSPAYAKKYYATMEYGDYEWD